jgi:hypothetical protein
MGPQRRRKTVAKIDLKKELKHLYNPSAKQVSVVDVPPMCFLMVDGAGDPNVSAEYEAAVKVLYSLSYTLKFGLKKSAGIDYAVMPLEGLWWTDDPDYDMRDKTAWQWTAMIMQPDFITAERVAEAMDEVRGKKELVALDKVRLESLHEGLCAQIMHIGPYAAEEPTIARLHAFIRENGYELRGKHHEIYLSDPRRTAPDKLRTPVRQPIRMQG